MKYEEFLNQMSLAAMQRSIGRSVEKVNSMPVDDFCGLSPKQMTALTTRIGSPGCAVRLRERIPEEVIAAIPIFRLVEELLKMAAREGRLELTKLGFLKRKHLHELYGHGFFIVPPIEEKIGSLRNEWDWPAADCARAVLHMGRWTRRYRGNLELTKLGRKMASGSRETLFRSFFEILTVQLEWADHGGPENLGAIQDCVGYSFWLVNRFGREWRTSDFYGNKFLTAFPMILPEGRTGPGRSVVEDVLRIARGNAPGIWEEGDFPPAGGEAPAAFDPESKDVKFFRVFYSLRTFFSYFIWLGTVEARLRDFPEPPLVRKTTLFDRLFEIRL